jgi:hypothetical protein
MGESMRHVVLADGVRIALHEQGEGAPVGGARDKDMDDLAAGVDALVLVRGRWTDRLSLDRFAAAWGRKVGVS